MFDFLPLWEKLAHENGGRLKITKTRLSPVGMGMSVWHRVYLIIPYKDSEIIFFYGETSRASVTYKFSKLLNYNFLIYSEDYIDKIAKFFGLLSECETGDADFDKMFCIKCNDTLFIKHFLKSNLQAFLMLNTQILANFKMITQRDSSKIELNLFFDERNLSRMEELLNFIKNSVDNILEANRLSRKY